MSYFIKQHKLIFSALLALSILVSVSIVMMAFILQEIVDTALQQNWSAFTSISVKTAIFLVLFGIVFYGYGVIVAKFKQRIVLSMRSYMMDGVMGKSIQQYETEPTSNYLSMLTNDVKQIEDNYLNAVINIMQNSIMFVLSLAALFYLNIYVTLVLVVCVVLMFIAPSLISKVLERKQTAVSEQMAKFTAHIKDVLDGFEVLYSFRVLRQAKQRFQGENQQTAKLKFAADHVNAINNSLSNVLGVIAQFAVILVAGYLIIKGELTGGGLVALVQLSGSIVSPIVSIFSDLPRMKSVRAIVSKLLQQNDTAKADTIQALASDNEQQEIKSGHLELRGVSFAYNEAEKPVLHHINETINLGGKYAIMGESGCGKTTLVKLIAGQLTHTNGRIMWEDKTELSTEQLISLSAMVSQRVFLFNDTLLNNITLYESFTDEQMNQALEKSGMNKFIHMIEDGLQSDVGEGGSALSGGQKQRVSIARALIRDKAIVILDEGTSALDVQTSYDVEKQLLEQEALTLLTITHQVNEQLLRRYDRIIYMEAGRIVETGTYDELVNANRKFQSFITIKEHNEVIAS